MEGEGSGGPRLKVLELFEEGKRFTEELLRENERLRLAAARLRQERAGLDGRLAAAEALQERNRLLEREVVTLRDELDALKRQFLSVEEENREFADRYVRVERQNSDLINLYVASYRLHSTLEYGEVLSIVKEIVINMIGAENFGVYVMDEPENRLVLVAHEGLESREGETVPVGQGEVGEAARTARVYVADNPLEVQQRGSAAIACIPMSVGDRVVGVIAIHRLLVQKDGFQPVDFDLFELLGGHAATALYGATLYCLSERKRTTLEGFIDILKTEAGCSSPRR